jgi:hypothetical protein
MVDNLFGLSIKSNCGPYKIRKMSWPDDFLTTRFTSLVCHPKVDFRSEERVRRARSCPAWIFLQGDVTATSRILQDLNW